MESANVTEIPTPHSAKQKKGRKSTKNDAFNHQCPLKENHEGKFTRRRKIVTQGNVLDSNQVYRF